MQENNENTETDDDKEDFKNVIRWFLYGDRFQKSYKTEKQIAFVRHIFCHNHSKNPSVFTMKKI